MENCAHGIQLALWKLLLHARVCQYIDFDFCATYVSFKNIDYAWYIILNFLLFLSAFLLSFLSIRIINYISKGTQRGHIFYNCQCFIRTLRSENCYRRWKVCGVTPYSMYATFILNISHLILHRTFSPCQESLICCYFARGP